MENAFDTSFIPTQPLLRVEGRAPRTERVNMSLVLALVILFVTTAVALGLYYYRGMIREEVAIRTERLDTMESAIDLSELKRLKEIDARMKLAQNLLGSHVAFSLGLDLFEQTIADTVALRQFSYATEKMEGDLFRIEGLAADYATVYVQAERWRATTGVRRVNVTNIQLDEQTGEVMFGAEIAIEREVIEFATALADANYRSETDSSLTIATSQP
jgi:uncharacterized protein (DUF2164 family)